MDQFDAVATRTLAEQVHELAEAGLEEMTAGLCREGTRGKTCRGLLAREIAISRLRLRYIESLLNIETRKMLEGRGNERLVRTLERQVGQTHRRLVASVNSLARIEQPAPRLTVVAHQAVVMGGEGER